MVSCLETTRLTTLFCTHIGSLCIFQCPKQHIYLVLEELKGENPLHLQINFRSLISGGPGREEHFPSAFCVKKFCLNNYLSVPFARSQHHHSSTFCFQLVLISNGLLTSICSQHHQSAQYYPETWGNLKKAKTYRSVQRSL